MVTIKHVYYATHILIKVSCYYININSWWLIMDGLELKNTLKEARQLSEEMDNTDSIDETFEVTAKIMKFVRKISSIEVDMWLKWCLQKY